jgi:threonine synthase
MKYYSTNNHSHNVSLKDAVIHGLAPDQGLYMPETIPVLTSSFFNSISDLSFQEISYQVASSLLGEDIDERELKSIVNHTIQFDAPLVEVEENIFSLELFHGPTLAFKDFGARFLSRLLGHFAKQENREIIILVATSGDTGSAVANGFFNVPGTKVVVLYPSKKVSDIQEKQFTTLGGNITALEVEGTFDDCQRMVKQAFSDKELNESLFLTSANSINVARLIPQSFYYFYAYSKLSKKRRDNDIIISVPSGNFGNITAGLIAKRMGLPIGKFIASTNVNKVVPDYFSNRIFTPKPSMSTISNAMDVGNPSNFPRILDLYNDNFEILSSDVTTYSFTDDETKVAMKEVFNNCNYILDPHGAVGYLGLKKYISEKKQSDFTGIFLETAHPGKFSEVVEETLNIKLTLPDRLSAYLKGEKQSIPISSSFEKFKSMLPTLIA